MTLNIKDKPKDGFERVVYAEEDKFNFYSVIAIHNTKRGPALGGCRYFNYQDLNKQEEDVLKLAEAMTYKNSCLLYTSPSPRDKTVSRMPSSA